MSPEAITLLDSVNRNQLSSADQHYYDLLYIKSRDKNYVVHTSDSLILDVIDYYSHHPNSGLYTEALYYGGRVYSDLGDLPTSLIYFQKALETIPEEEKYNRLHGVILSQTGRLLNSLYLYAEAVPYLEQAIHYDSLTQNVYGQAYDYQLLGAIKMHQKDYESATLYIQQAVRLAANLSETDSANMSLYLAEIQLVQDHPAKAASLIQGLPEKVDAQERDLALSLAADAYFSKGALDTAYYYARELIRTPGVNQQNGFEILFQPEMMKFSHPDSLVNYCREFYGLVHDYLNQHDAQEALMQNSMFNYRKHVQERDAARASEHRVVGGLIGAFIIILVLIIVLLFMKNRNARQIIKLREALDMIERLQADRTTPKEEMYRSAEAVSSELSIEKWHFTATSLRNQIRQRLQERAVDYVVPAVILESEAHQQLIHYLEAEKGFSDRDPLWKALEEVVEQTFPGFKSRLRLLTDNRMTEADWQIALLIKCGVVPHEMAKLLHKTVSTITSRRSYLTYKIFGEKNMGAKVIDGVIGLI
jgi:tetratricopeptide (TPR) repeat protein